MRHQRRAVSAADQARASASLCAHLKYFPGFMTAERVGLYLVNDGEIDPVNVMTWVWSLAPRTGKVAYVPVLAKSRQSAMSFSEVWPDTQFSNNKYGIPEPVFIKGGFCRAQDLDIILVPLVAFDRSGNRIGMGGGYYDQTLAFRHQQTYYRRPKLIGVAHHFQEIDALDPKPWDVGLDAIVTDREVIVCGG